MVNAKILAIVAVLAVVGAGCAVAMTQTHGNSSADDAPTFSIKQTYDGTNYETLNLKKCDRLVGTSTIYMTSIYYLLCEKYHETPYSDGALHNTALVNEFQFVVAGGTPLDYIKDNTELYPYFDSSKYYDGGSASLKNYDSEKMMQNVADAVGEEHYRVLFMGSYVTSASMAADYPTVRANVKSAGAVEAVFPETTDFLSSFAGIELVAYLFGYEEYVADLISHLQTDLYNVYKTAKASDKYGTLKCYWEGNSGKSVKMSGMSSSIIDFLGWNSIYSKSVAQDTEDIISKEPDVIIFYTNDTRTDAEKGLTQYTTWTYTLINVDMGGITATPKFVPSLVAMCTAVYGDVGSTYTLEQAKADTAFWDTYAGYTSAVTPIAGA